MTEVRLSVPIKGLDAGDLATVAMSYIAMALLQGVRSDAHEVMAEQGEKPDTGFVWPPGTPWEPSDNPAINLRKAMLLLEAELGDPPGNEHAFPDQTEIADWAYRNFGTTQTDMHSMVGWIEEVFELQSAMNRWYETFGKLARAINKREQDVRGTQEQWLKEIRKELGDVYIKGCDVVDRMGYTWAELAADRWAVVGQRDYTQDRAGVVSAGDDGGRGVPTEGF